MPKRTSDKPKVAIKREQRLLTGSVECSNFTEGKSRFKNRLAIILKQILNAKKEGVSIDTPSM